MCQKAVGGPYLVVMPLALGDCGTPFSYRSDGSGRINLTIATLDHPELRPPTRQYDLDARIPWVDTLHAVPGQHDAGLKPEVAARLVNLQHPDHETPAGWQPPAGASS
jgi:hypothetical protein